jgi:hypothetical protein
MLSQYDGTPHAQKSLRLEVPLLLQKSSHLKTASDDYERSRKIQETKNKEDQINAIKAQKLKKHKFFSSQRERETGSRLMDQEVVLPPCPCFSPVSFSFTQSKTKTKTQLWFRSSARCESMTHYAFK